MTNESNQQQFVSNLKRQMEKYKQPQHHYELKHTDVQQQSPGYKIQMWRIKSVIRNERPMCS